MDVMNAQSYLKIGKAPELMGRKDRLIFRALEILPGFSIYATFGLLFFLSWQKPVWVAVFIIGFDLYWFFRAIYFSFHAQRAYKKMRDTLKIDWSERLYALPQEKYSIKAASFKDIYHLVIFPMYDEPFEVAEGSFLALRNSQYPKDRLIVVLATEEKAGKAAAAVAERIEREFGKDFGHFLVSAHPMDIAGELAGKGSNETWAARIVKEKIIDPDDIPYERVIVSTFDIDTIVPAQYFARLTHAFLTAKNPVRTSFQPIAVFTNNIWEAPAISRVLAFSTTFWQAISQERPNRILTFSSHSMSFKALVDIDFWQTNVVSEDSRIFWQCFLHYNGDYGVEPLYFPVYMDANLAHSFWQTMKNIYKQQRRWAYGAGDVAYFLFGFLKNKKIPLMKKISRGFFTFEGYHSWATNAIVIFLFGWVPLVVGGEEFRSSVFAYNLPQITKYIMTVAMFGIIVAAYYSMVILPPRPKTVAKKSYFFMILQWVFVPLASIIFSAIPAIEAQTRWMFGKYMGFWVTEKFRKNFPAPRNQIPKSEI